MPRESASDSISWQDEARLATIITWVAAAIAVFVALSGPMAYFWLSYEAQVNESAIAARLHAAFVTQAINASSGDWRQEVSDLIDTDLAPSSLPEIRAIHDGDGRTVSRSGAAVAPPLITQTAALAGRDGPVGTVVISRSLRPLLANTAGVALLGAMLGVAIYASLRLLPLRALRRTLAALRRREAKAREEAEEHLRIVFEHSIEGIVLFSPDGRIASCNPAAAAMFGYGANDLPGMPLAQLVHPPAGALPDDPFPVQHCETRAWRKGDRAFPVDLAVSETRVTGAPQRIGIFRDITERKEAEARLSHLANYDSLTGLPNRTLFRDRLALAMERTRRSGQAMALMLLDLDRFKTINDSLGHDIGDQLLKQVSKTLARCLRKTDSLAHGSVGGMTVSRLGGDEFTILAEGLRGPGAAAMVAQRVLEALSQPFLVGDHEIFVSTSIGVTLYPKSAADLDGLIKQADMAMYRAKERGRNTYHFHSDDLDAEATERLALEAGLRHAIGRDEFRLHYQPKANVRNGALTGVEALLRWQPTDREPVGPDRFIPILEETGLIIPVGTWVIRRACEQMVTWRRLGLPPFTLAVNLSVLQLRQPDLAGQIAAILAETGLEPTLLEVELTESMLMDDSANSLRVLSSLAAMGLRLAIDDFGTGHSSLSYLKRFNVDTLKIDRSFVRDTPDDPEDNAIATAIVALAHSLNLKVVAEGVETEAQAAFLRQLDCDEMQGYLLSRPLPPEAFAAWLRQYVSRDTASLTAV